MNKKILIGGAGLLALAALGFGARHEYVEAEVAGCKKTVIYDIEQQYGEIPDDVKVKVLQSLNVECRKIL